MALLSFEGFWAQDRVFHGWLERGRRIQEDSCLDCRKMVQLVVVACTRDDPGKGQIKGKKMMP